ncbi:MAG: NAD-dependent epimerase/dehydratase family protein [Candidatus Lokiarchaeota archaeon]|nr:NAD-dependent epimerase/dehydratase family protein [Candidatus Lokiarchaeota archaeon]
MKAAVTGANGFIGSYLCRHLVANGIDVHAVVRKTSDLSLLKDLVPDLEGITLEHGDVTDIESLKRIFVGMDVVINTAAVLKGFKQEDYDRVNVDGYKNVCDALLEVNPGLQRVIMFSSIAAAGPSSNGILLTEDDPPRPVVNDFYGTSKYTMEQAIKPYMDKLPISIVRPPSVFGGGDVVSFDLFKAVKMGIGIIVGKEIKPYSVVDVRDLVDGVYRMIIRPEARGQLFYFGTGDPIDWGALQDFMARTVFNRKKKIHKLALSAKGALRFASMLEFFGKITGTPPFLNKSKMIEAGQGGWAISYEKAKKMLGWEPRQTIESMLKDAAKWYVDHGWL